MKKTVRDMDVAAKRVLVRNDFNVPLENGRITDDTRIRAALPTLHYLLEQEARVVCCSHLGRPGGEVKKDLCLAPIGERLSDLLAVSVRNLSDCIGPEVDQAKKEMAPGEIILLENTRFYSQEKKNDDAFAAALARGMDLFVNDAFGAAHRAHASTEGVARHLPSAAGLLMADELEALDRFRENPRKPLAVIFGGAKISDKIGVLERFLEKAEILMIGGAMATTFFKAMGYEVGASLFEGNGVAAAKTIMEKAGQRLMLPVDVVIAKQADVAEGQQTTVEPDRVLAGWQILDVGPETIRRFHHTLKNCGSVIWNGPLGLFEKSPFDAGTMAMAEILAGLSADTCVGGGDTAAAVNQAGMADRMSHVSTGGGAFLEYMEGRELPGVAVLPDREREAEAASGQNP